MRIETIAVHAGHAPDPVTADVTPAIHLSTTFEREADGSYRAGYVYSRYANPNRTSLEQCLAQLEGGASAACFSSGSAATHAVCQALGPGAHIIAPDDAYFGTTKLMRDIFGPWGLELSLVDMTDLDAVRAALRPSTRLVWIETPSNPLVRVSDIAALSALAHEVGAIAVVDNTWATPVLQRPLELGADISMHSTTKYIGGHSDVLGGALVARAEDAFWERVRAVQASAGTVPSPFECWLALRGVRTLPWRVRGMTSNAQTLAAFLSTHAHVTAVHYPGLTTHHAHEIAQRQMSAPGAMMSFEVAGGAEAAMAAAGRLRIITRATSLGGTETLIEHRASVEGPGTRAPAGLLRMSVGLEHVEDLMADLDQALR
ncbi:MAG TPA: aminotransferase class I/II-fold pyridoxal phosphate-dependent enzyme [Gemmatimonadaceae bacterium]|nr:aminotransferase class I/II-fold pyridoxal phosphate-dependent enzyme [Gemmatimonadaceae bacterium]